MRPYQFIMLVFLSLIFISCGEDEAGISCTTNATVDRSTSGNECARAEVTRYQMNTSQDYESITIQFDLPTYNCRLSIDPNPGLIEEKLYELGSVGFTQTDLARTDMLSANITKFDRENGLISGTFNFSGAVAVSGGLADITYSGTFTDVEFE